MLNKKVYIVSICMKKISGERYEFHFKGFYQGLQVKRLIVSGGEFEPFEEYLIKAKVLGFKEGSLYCKCLRLKSIFNR